MGASLRKPLAARFYRVQEGAGGRNEAEIGAVSLSRGTEADDFRRNPRDRVLPLKWLRVRFHAEPCDFPYAIERTLERYH